MKIIFVYPDIAPAPTNIITKYAFPKWTGDENLGLSSLAGCLKKAGHEVSLVHITNHVSEPIKKKEFINIFSQHVTQNNNILVGFSSMSAQFCFVQEWSQWIKEEYSFPIACGGVHTIMNPDEVLKLSSIDIACVGEGEIALVELCNALENGNDIKHIDNLWVKENGQIYRNPISPLIQDMDSLPFPDKTIYDFKNLYSPKNEKTAAFSGSRGCPFSCTYCCNHRLREIHKNSKSYLRYKSINYLIAEIEDTLQKFPFIEKLVFHDDMFAVGKKRLSEFAEKYPGKIGLPFVCNCHPNSVDEETASLLKKAGCTTVRIGIESGNDHIRRNILKRPISKEQIIRAAACLKKEGIIVYPYNIVGLPFEDPLAILDTIKLNAQIKTDITVPTIFYPYEKTALYDICKNEGFLVDKKIVSYFLGTKLSLPTLTKTQIMAYRNLFSHLVKVYTRIDELPAKLSKTMTGVLDSALCNKPFLLACASCLYAVRLALTPFRFAALAMAKKEEI